MRAFIIRPFGTKADTTGKEIDFENVERALIAPALAALGYEGRTTQEITHAGNIRVDMFRLLVTADLVIADMSIHNANVFYELGVRHALRDRQTYLIKCKADATVFDLQTDRYLQYDRDNPGASLDSLVRGLRETQASTTVDSPVFLLLPDLQVQSRSLFLTVPTDFTEEVEKAASQKRLGDLELVSEEARGFEWESAGLRTIGRRQFELKAFEGARLTWEAVREIEGEDLEANTLLGTIYQRLDDLMASDQALRRALSQRGIEAQHRAELLSLMARNAKTRWLADWRTAPDEERQRRALDSAWLEDAANAYASGFEADMNHFYSGLNALAMLIVQDGLVAVVPDAWGLRFGDPGEAERENALRANRMTQLSAAVELSVEAALRRQQREGKTDVWAEISRADLRCLTATAPATVAHAYRRALAGAPDLAIDAARGQLELYQDLGVRADNVRAALATFPPAAAARASGPSAARPRVVLFTGHMIDAPGREIARFPPDKEALARQTIHDMLSREIEESGEIGVGIAGGASGGDILFHEVCAELGIATEMYLVIPRDRFVAASVSHAGPQWVERFNRLYERLPRQVLLAGDELPRWLRGKPGYGIWQRNNLWMLHNALSLGHHMITLLALWDGESGGGPGGTQDMIQKAQTSGAKVVVENTKQLFQL